MSADFVLSRRTLLVAGAAGAVLAACKPQLAKRFNGYCFVANKGSHTLAVVNLTRFRVDKHVALESAPDSVMPHAQGSAVLALLPSAGTVVEVPAATLVISRSKKLAAQAIGMRITGRQLWVLGRDPQRLERLDLQTWQRGQGIALPHAATDFDIAPDGSAAIISFASRKQCLLFDLPRNAVISEIALATEPGIVRFRPDGKQILIGSPEGKTITTVDRATGKVQVTLPIPFAPERFCFSNDNGGQMFATGLGMDAVAIVAPYQTELSQTILAGRQPGAMTVNDTLLFVANPPTGDVTVIEIASQQVMARISSGEGPCAIALTPDGEYGLVLNRVSGTLAVVRLSKLTDLRYKRAPLFTVIPVGEEPVAAAVCRI